MSDPRKAELETKDFREKLLKHLDRKNELTTELIAKLEELVKAIRNLGAR